MKELNGTLGSMHQMLTGDSLERVLNGVLGLMHGMLIGLGTIVPGMALAAMAGPGPLALPESEPVPPVTLTIEVDGGAAYLKENLTLKFTFVNNAEPSLTIDSQAFGPGAFTLKDPKGRGPGAATDAAAPGTPLVVEGYGSTEHRVNLSAWYPKLTAKETTWEIAWSHPPFAEPPLKVRIIRPHDPEKDRFAEVETDLGTMKWALLPNFAPKHVRRFVDLARQGHYDGLTFFRYVPGVQAEGGAPAGGESDQWVRLVPPELAPDLVPVQGLIGAVRPQGSTTTSMTSDSIFFVTLGDAGFMQGSQTFFGRIVKGYEVMARMNQIENRGPTGDARAYLLANPVTIRKITISRR